MTKEHLIRIADVATYKTACGIDAHFKWITIYPRGVTCQRCVRCMTPKEVARFLGRGPLTGVSDKFEVKCYFCNSTELTKYKVSAADDGASEVQRYKCKACHRDFFTIKMALPPKELLRLHKWIKKGCKKDFGEERTDG